MFDALTPFNPYFWWYNQQNPMIFTPNQPTPIFPVVFRGSVAHPGRHAAAEVDPERQLLFIGPSGYPQRGPDLRGRGWSWWISKTQQIWNVKWWKTTSTIMVDNK